MKRFFSSKGAESSESPLLVLAPMQDVTDLKFWRLIHRYGGADLYFTEYFRVHPTYKLDRKILQSICENPTGRPVIAQLIGNDADALVRFARELGRYPVAAVDLNLGCPAPVVYRKCAGGGLLRDLSRIDRILGAMRENIPGRFTVKTRIGFDTADEFPRLLATFARHSLDMLTVHGRTVTDGYRSSVRFDLIRVAVDFMPCPVLANGNVYSAEKALAVLRETGAAGIMIGRHAIRNPWIFSQIREGLSGKPYAIPTGRDVLRYIRDLYAFVQPEDLDEAAYIKKLKKYMNFIGLGIDPDGHFLHEIRRVKSRDEFFVVCERHLDHDRLMPLDPFDLQLPPRDTMAGVTR